MQNYRISINDLPPDGKEFDLDDPAIWQTPMREFGMASGICACSSSNTK